MEDSDKCEATQECVRFFGKRYEYTPDGMRNLFLDMMRGEDTGRVTPRDYGSINENDVRMLGALINEELLAHNNDLPQNGCNLHMFVSNVVIEVPQFSDDCYRPESKFHFGNRGYVLKAKVLVDGTDFDGRESVSLNTRRYIGFPDWAGEDGIKPFLRGFARWVTEWQTWRLKSDGAKKG